MTKHSPDGAEHRQFLPIGQDGIDEMESMNQEAISFDATPVFPAKFT
jgi:hypothetical protein